MFNTIRVGKTHTEYVPYEKSVTVNEHRAPTDKSVELLNEFQEKAKENIIRVTPVSDNTINGISVVFHSDLAGRGTDMISWMAKFKLNGTDHIIKGQMTTAEYDEKKIQFSFQGKDIMIHDVYRHFVKCIAEQLMDKLIGGPVTRHIFPEYFKD